MKGFANGSVLTGEVLFSWRKKNLDLRRHMGVGSFSCIFHISSHPPPRSGIFENVNILLKPEVKESGAR